MMSSMKGTLKTMMCTVAIAVMIPAEEKESIDLTEEQVGWLEHPLILFEDLK